MKGMGGSVGVELMVGGAFGGGDGERCGVCARKGGIKKLR